MRQTPLAGGLVTLSVRQGNLLEETTEVIINPANMNLQHGAGVAGDIVKAGGQIIQDESDDILNKFGSGVIPVGNCVATSAGSLPFKKIVHTVGPYWIEGGYKKPL